MRSQYLLGDRQTACVVLLSGLVFRLCYVDNS